MSAASAWQLSEHYRVLLISLDPAHNLGDIFGITLKNTKIRFTNNLYLQEVDLHGLSREYLQREIKVLSSTYQYLQTLNLDNYFSILRYSPGIEEYALLTSIEETIRNEKEFDFIIFDTPPTGLTLRFLALPSVTITWIDRLIQIRRKILEKRHTIRKIRGFGEKGNENEEMVLDYDEKDDDVLKRLWSLNDNYQNLNATLQGQDCSVILVFNPDILSLKESERLIEGLTVLKLPLRLMINNKLTEETQPMAEEVEKAMNEMAGDVHIERVFLSPLILDSKDGILYEIPQDIASILLERMDNNV